MNMDKNPKVSELRDLIKATNDRAGHHVLWVAKNGDVRVSMIPGDQSPIDFEQSHPDMQLRLETFIAGNDYVGPNAADDSDWMNELFEALRAQWAKAKGKKEVQYVDSF